MANDDNLDEHLRRMAKGSMERRASAVDSDAALNDHRSRLDSPRTSSQGDRRCSAAAAAVGVVVVGVAAIAWPRGAGDEGLVATETVATLPPPPPSTGPVSVTTDATTTTVPGATSASALPSTVRAGGTSQPPLSDGSRVRLDGRRSESRCINQPLVRSGATASDDPDTAISEARSIAVAANGKLLATRDVCPAGTKWGDPETFSELVEMDPASATPSVISLRTWQSDPDQIVFDDDNRVIALGERTLAGVSPDGRYVALREQYESDAERWSLIDLGADATLLSPASICERAGDIVGPPRFVNDHVVVIARLCNELHTGDDNRGGDVQVEAVDLASTQSGDSIVWNSSVPGLGVDDFTRSVGLSARQHTDNAIWAIMSGNGGFEISPRTYALHSDEIVEVTRNGYQAFAFQAADLLTECDTPPT